MFFFSSDGESIVVVLGVREAETVGELINKFDSDFLSKFQTDAKRTDRQTDTNLTDRQTDGHKADRQTDRKTDTKRTNRHKADKQRNRQKVDGQKKDFR